MSLVVLGIKSIENNKVKESRVYKDGKTVNYSFHSPKNFKPRFQTTWCTKHIHRISWSSGYEITK